MDTTALFHLIGKIDAMREAQQAFSHAQSDIRGRQLAHSETLGEILLLVKSPPVAQAAAPAPAAVAAQAVSRWRPLLGRALMICFQSAGGIYAIFLALKSGDIATAYSTALALLSAG